MAYQYYNANPNGYHIPDCVVRAICLATGLSYYDTIQHLFKNGLELKCDCLNVRCYEKMLDYDFDFPHFYGCGNTVEEIAEDFPNDILLLRISGHLTCSIRGTLMDIWDCSKEYVTDFWIVE